MTFRIILGLSCPNVSIGHPQATKKLDSRYQHAGVTCASPYLNCEKWQIEPFMSNVNRTQSVLASQACKSCSHCLLDKAFIGAEVRNPTSSQLAQGPYLALHRRPRPGPPFRYCVSPSTPGCTIFRGVTGHSIFSVDKRAPRSISLRARSTFRGASAKIQLKLSRHSSK